MCNCGKKRVQYSQQSFQGAVTHGTGARMATATPKKNFAHSVFEYVGKTALTIRGNVTGTNYRFNFPGNKQNIDNRDAEGIRSVPVLKKVAK